MLSLRCVISRNFPKMKTRFANKKYASRSCASIIVPIAEIFGSFISHMFFEMTRHCLLGFFLNFTLRGIFRGHKSYRTLLICWRVPLALEKRKMVMPFAAKKKLWEKEDSPCHSKIWHFNQQPCQKLVTKTPLWFTQLLVPIKKFPFSSKIWLNADRYWQKNDFQLFPSPPKK